MDGGCWRCTRSGDGACADDRGAVSFSNIGLGECGQEQTDHCQHAQHGNARAAAAIGNGDDALHYYRKVGTRKAQAISKICFAAYARRERGGVLGEVRIGLGSVAPTVVRARSAESVISGRSIEPELIATARQAILGDISPIDDIRSTFEYRTHVSANLVEDFLSRASRP